MSQPFSLLSDRRVVSAPGLVCTGDVTAFPGHWQEPAATEKAAFESVLEHGEDLGFDFLAFPWATLIDGLHRRSLTLSEVLRGLSQATHQMARKHDRLVIVAQHIQAHKFMRLYEACGVTDMFWSHCTKSSPLMNGIRVHPFPLYPAQTAKSDEKVNLHAPRKYLANFMGAYNPKVYLSDVRQHIFEDAGKAKDCLIVKRDAWHFDRHVYSEQMHGLSADQAQKAIEEQHKQEYLDAIRQSAFTLCPSGSGPNSIRIGEALALGSVPIIITRSLALPGDAALWDRACIIEEDSEAGYRRALDQARAMSSDTLRAKQIATQQLYAYYRPKNYTDIIKGALGTA